MERHVWSVLSVVVAWLAFAPGAHAGKIGLVDPQPVGKLSVQVPLASALEPYSENHVYVIEDRPPAQVLVFHLSEDGSATPEEPIDLPDDVTPVDLWWDFDGELHIETREKRSFVYCPGCNELREIERRPAAIEFIGGVAEGYETEMLSDYGSGSTGSLWWGANFAQQLILATGEHPGAIDFGGYGGVANGVIIGGFATYDGFRDRIIMVSDAQPPTETGAIDGPAGVQQLSGLTISPLNLTPRGNGSAQLPMFVSSPGTMGINTGNVYSSIDWSSGAAPSWQPISPTPTGIPTGLDAGCRFLVADDYANDVINIYRFMPPQGAECEEGIELMKISSTSKKRFTVSEDLTPYTTGSGRTDLSVDLPGLKKSVSANAKVDVQAGHLETVKVKFSKKASAAIDAALADARKLKGKAAVKVTDAGGHKVAVTEPLTVKRH